MTVDTITIEKLDSPYFAQAAQWLARPDVNRWLTSDWRDRPVGAPLIAVVARNARNRLFLVRCNGQPCGLVALADLDAADGTAMVWYALGEQRLGGRGITSEAVRQLVRHAFQELNLRCVYAWAMADNIASQRVLLKSGFREAGSVRNAASSRGVQVDRVYFDILPAEYPAQER
jgi:RimJ/RimL family protein N-acetyltransferase